MTKKGNVVATVLVAIMVLVSVFIYTQHVVLAPRTSDESGSILASELTIRRSLVMGLYDFLKGDMIKENSFQPGNYMWYCNYPMPASIEQIEGSLTYYLNQSIQDYVIMLESANEHENLTTISDPVITINNVTDFDHLINEAVSVSVMPFVIGVTDGKTIKHINLSTREVFYFRLWYMYKEIYHWMQSDGGNLTQHVFEEVFDITEFPCQMHKCSCAAEEAPLISDDDLSKYEITREAFIEKVNTVMGKSMQAINGQFRDSGVQCTFMIENVDVLNTKVRNQSYSRFCDYTNMFVIDDWTAAGPVEFKAHQSPAYTSCNPAVDEAIRAPVIEVQNAIGERIPVDYRQKADIIPDETNIMTGSKVIEKIGLNTATKVTLRVMCTDSYVNIESTRGYEPFSVQFRMMLDLVRNCGTIDYNPWSTEMCISQVDPGQGEGEGEGEGEQNESEDSGSGCPKIWNCTNPEDIDENKNRYFAHGVPYTNAYEHIDPVNQRCNNSCSEEIGEYDECIDSHLKLMFQYYNMYDAQGKVYKKYVPYNPFDPPTPPPNPKPNVVLTRDVQYYCREEHKAVKDCMEFCTMYEYPLGIKERCTMRCSEPEDMKYDEWCQQFCKVCMGGYCVYDPPQPPPCPKLWNCSNPLNESKEEVDHLFGNTIPVYDQAKDCKMPLNNYCGQECNDSVYAYENCTQYWNITNRTSTFFEDINPENGELYNYTTTSQTNLKVETLLLCNQEFFDAYDCVTGCNPSHPFSSDMQRCAEACDLENRENKTLWEYCLKNCLQCCGGYCYMNNTQESEQGGGGGEEEGGADEPCQDAEDDKLIVCTEELNQGIRSDCLYVQCDANTDEYECKTEGGVTNDVSAARQVCKIKDPLIYNETTGLAIECNKASCDMTTCVPANEGREIQGGSTTDRMDVRYEFCGPCQKAVCDTDGTIRCDPLNDYWNFDPNHKYYMQHTDNPKDYETLFRETCTDFESTDFYDDGKHINCHRLKCIEGVLSCVYNNNNYMDYREKISTSIAGIFTYYWTTTKFFTPKSEVNDYCMDNGFESQCLRTDTYICKDGTLQCKSKSTLGETGARCTPLTGDYGTEDSWCHMCDSSGACTITHNDNRRCKENACYRCQNPSGTDPGQCEIDYVYNCHSDSGCYTGCDDQGNCAVLRNEGAPCPNSKGIVDNNCTMWNCTRVGSLPYLTCYGKNTYDVFTERCCGGAEEWAVVCLQEQGCDDYTNILGQKRHFCTSGGIG